MKNEIDIIEDIKDDVRAWLVDHWENTVRIDMLRIGIDYYEQYGIEDVIDVETMIEDISDNIQQGVINVIKTYEK